MAVNLWPTQCRQHSGQYIKGFRLKSRGTMDYILYQQVEKRRGMLASALKEHNKMSHLGEHAMTHALYVFLYTSSFSWALWADRSSHPQ